MSSIGSTLNSINTSLLNEISSITSTQRTSGSASTTSNSSTNYSDTLDFSKVAELFKELGTLVATGQLRPRETIAHGIESAPEAFLGLLKGKNFGKQLVKLID